MLTDIISCGVSAAKYSSGHYSEPIFPSEKASKYNNEIFSATRDFERNEKKVEALEALTFDDFVEFFHRYLISDERRKISSQVREAYQVLYCAYFP